MSFSPFVSQELHFHRLGRHNIQGFNCTVYYSDFFRYADNTDHSLVVTIILHVVGKNPKMHYILNKDGSVMEYTISSELHPYDAGRIRQWVEMHNNVIWCNGLSRVNKIVEKTGRVPDLPRIYC